MIKFDCANECIHKYVCKYFEQDMCDLDEKLKKLDICIPGIDLVVKCKAYRPASNAIIPRSATYDSAKKAVETYGK